VFEDLIALVALYRPGPMDLIPSFCARKHGKEEVEYPHPLMERGAQETYGIMVYQEQVMQAPSRGRLLAGRRRPAAPRHGQEEGRGDGPAPEIFRRGRGKKGIRRRRPTRSST
jgi:DNA polymerase-3 subunit alpha